MKQNDKSFNMKIHPNRLDRGFFRYQEEFEQTALGVLRSGWYILGDEVAAFEKEFTDYTGAAHCVGLASGLDALWIALKLLGIGPGDEVIVQSNAYIACVMGITMSGAAPVFVEPDVYNNIDISKIEEKITGRTRAIMPVHLYGQASDMESVMRIARAYNLRVVEDCAQSHGACWNGRQTGTWGDAGCFSFYPSKNLGAFGDGGAIITNDADLADKLRVFRNYGSDRRYYNKVVGTNSRLDEMQAALLRVRLRHLGEINDERAYICGRYLSEVNNPLIELPVVAEDAGTVWHQFVVRVRDRGRFIDYLDSKGIGTLIHYPVPPHLSEAYAYLGYKKGAFPVAERYADTVLSLPLYNGMTDEEQGYVIEALNKWDCTM